MEREYFLLLMLPTAFNKSFLKGNLKKCNLLRTYQLVIYFRGYGVFSRNHFLFLEWQT